MHEEFPFWVYLVFLELPVSSWWIHLSLGKCSSMILLETWSVPLTRDSFPSSILKIQRFSLFSVPHNSCISFSYVPSLYPTSLLISLRSSSLFSILLFCLLCDWIYLCVLPSNFLVGLLGFHSHIHLTCVLLTVSVLNSIFKIWIFFFMPSDLHLWGLDWA